MTKKSIILLIFISLFTILSGENLFDRFMEYQQDPTEEKLLETLQYYQNLQIEDPDDYQIPLLLAHVHYLELNRYIMTLYENIDSLYVSTQFQFANLLLSLNQYEQSLEIYNMITEATPQWSCAWRHKGEAYYYAGKLEEAESALKEAITTRPEHYDAYVWLAFIQKEQERYAEALETLDTGLDYYGKDIEDPDEELDALDVEFLLLELYDKNEYVEEYQSLRERLLEIAPDDPRWAGVTELQDVQ